MMYAPVTMAVMRAFAPGSTTSKVVKNLEGEEEQS